MRLEQLFENKHILSEAPGDLIAADRRTIMISPAEIYQMTGQSPPQIKGPNGRMVQPPGWYDKVEMPVGGKGGIDPRIATAHRKWVEGGRVPGLIWDDEKKGLKAYNENNILEDLGWQILAGAGETASAITKGGAKVIDDVFALVSSDVDYGENRLLKKTMATSKIVDGKRVYDEFMLDRFTKWAESKTDQKFRDNVDFTAGAVNSFGDIGDLFMGGIPGGWEGALGIMASELPSEILDIGLMVAGGGYGLAASGALNALEAGGAAASEIQKRIDKAYDEGILQQQPQYQVMLEAAQQQLLEDDTFNGTDEELNAKAADMARGQLTHSAINRAFYVVGATGGVLDTIQNKVLYGGPIKANFLKNAFGKAIIAPSTEAISEMGEQFVQNLGIMSAAGKITTPGEGVVNAGWNGWIAGHTATVVGTTADAIGGGNRMQKAARARLRQFFVGGSRDTQALIDIMGMDPNTLITNATDSEGRLNLHNMVKDRLVTSDMLKGKRPNRRGQFSVRLPDGTVQKVTRKQAKENDKNIELLQLMSSIDIDPKENVAVVMFKNDAEIRRTAELLGIDIEKKNINEVMAELEEVRKIDVRIQGKSKLEAPVWSELNERQRQEYIQTGKVKFVGDKERGTQTWTRQQIMFNSRRNQDEVPPEIANLLDNTDARPTMDPDDQREINSQQALIDGSPAMIQAKRALEADQKDWDEQAKQIGLDATIAEFGPRPSENMEGDPYNFTGARASTSESQRTIDQIKKNLADAQKDWDAQFGKTHGKDGVAIVMLPEVKNDSRFDAGPEIGTPPEQPSAVDDIDGDIPDITPITPADIDTTEPKLTTPEKKKIKPPVVVTTNPNDSLSRAHIIANAKIAIANGDMEPASVVAMIESLETTYPGIGSEVLPDGIDSYKQNPKAQVTKIQDETKENILPQEVPRNGKPPTGSIAIVDGQQYKFLGAMWAPIKPDGSLGSTGHQNHKRLNKIWQDSLIDTTEPGPLIAPEIDDNGRAIKVDETPPEEVKVGEPIEQPKLPSDTVQGPPDVPGPETEPTVSVTAPSFDTPTDTRDPLDIDTTPPAQVDVSDPPAQPKLGDTPNLDKITTPKPDSTIKFVEPSKLDPSVGVEVDPINVDTTTPTDTQEPIKKTDPKDGQVDTKQTDDEQDSEEEKDKEKGPIDQDPDRPGYQSRPPETDVVTTQDPQTDIKTQDIVDPTSTPVVLPKVDPTTKTDTKTTKPDSKITSKDQQQGKKKPRVGFAGTNKKDDTAYTKPNFDLAKFPDILKLNRNVGLARKQSGKLGTGLN